jgi:hypothetical protein
LSRRFRIRPYLIDFKNMMSFSVQCKAQARIDESPWFSWQPSQSIYGGIIVLGVNPRYLTEADWPRAIDFVAQGQRSNLVRELLAMAEFLEDSGQDRIALVEAVSALEAALNRFVKDPNVDGLCSSSIKKRMGLESLVALVNRLGLLPSIALLLPLLFSEEELPTEVLTSCRDAINERNNILHQGQRQVIAARLQQYLKAIRTLCEILLKRTDRGLLIKY